MAGAADGGTIRTSKVTGGCEHEGLTVDGFWFDRKDQNGYSTAPESLLSLSVPIGSNTKPIIELEAPNCHIRNCVFMNSALYALRVNGDGCSVENNLFVNCNDAGIDVYGKGRKLGTGYPFHKIKIKNNTFFSMWNAKSLESGAGSAVVQAGAADTEITDNIFDLSAGTSASGGWAVKDLRNFKADAWIHFKRNSVSQMMGGIAQIYDTGTSASLGIDKVSQLKDTCWDSADNDEENPMYKVDKDWFEKYCAQLPAEDVSKKPVVMDQNNQMRRMLGLPLDGGTRAPGKYLGLWYPIDHVKTGAFFTTENEKLKGRGVQAAGPFEIQRAPGLASAAASATETGAAPAEARTCADVDWDTLAAKGDTMYDQGVKFTAYYTKFDQDLASGFGKAAVPYLAGATKDTHKAIALRKVPECTGKDPVYKGFLAIASPAFDYLNTKCKRTGPSSGTCDFSFVVRGVVRKPGAKLVIEIESIAAQ